MNHRAAIEALLIAAPKPVSLKRLSQLVDISIAEVEHIIDILRAEYVAQDRGMRLLKHDHSVQFVSANDYAALVREFLGDETRGELTRPSLETLTIIAYRGPISKAELEQIRGVNCGLILRNLLIRGLVETIEDKIAGTRYQITADFLRFTGVTGVEELPNYDALHSAEVFETLAKEFDTANALTVSSEDTSSS